MKHIVLILLLLLVGCATKPMPAPTKFCGKNENINCIPMDPQSGQPGRGHSEEPKEKVMFYNEPEVIFKDEHTPSACRSPFR